MRTALPAALFAVPVLTATACFPARGETPGTAEIRRFIDQLGSGSFDEREKATAALDAAGEPALPGLRKASESDDAEVRRRAGELVRRIEHRVEADRLLTPTRVHLALENVPLADAVAELRKQSGFDVVLRDPGGRLKDRRLTLDTGETSFWEALDLLCRKAGVSEEPPSPVVLPVAPGVRPVPPAPRAAPAPAVPAMPAMPVIPAAPAGPGVVPPPPPFGVRFAAPVYGQIALIEGAPATVPTAYAGPVRVRGDCRPGTGNSDQIMLNLLVTLEAKARLHGTLLPRIDDAVDDQGQHLAPVTDEPAGPVAPFARRARVNEPTSALMLYLYPRLKAGKKQARSLREVRGALTGRMLTEPRPLITVEGVLNAVGTEVKGREGGAVRVLEATRHDDGRVLLRFELETPPDAMSPGLGAVATGRVRGPLVPVPAGGRAAPALAAADGTPTSRMTPELSLLDDKGGALEPYRVSLGLRQDNRLGLVRQYAFEFHAAADLVATKLVYSGCKPVDVEIPFTLKDIALR